MTELPCVLDTNVLISASLSRYGNPRKTVDLVVSSGILLFSPATFEEFQTRIRRPKFSRYFSCAEQVEGYINRMFAISTWVPSGSSIDVCKDPDDNKFLEVAIAGKAKFLITGNLVDFPPSSFRDIQIVNPAQFVRLQRG